jgi:hypothetical protein
VGHLEGGAFFIHPAILLGRCMIGASQLSGNPAKDTRPDPVQGSVSCCGVRRGEWCGGATALGDAAPPPGPYRHSGCPAYRSKEVAPNRWPMKRFSRPYRMRNFRCGVLLRQHPAFQAGNVAEWMLATIGVGLKPSSRIRPCLRACRERGMTVRFDHANPDLSRLAPGPFCKGD